ncbi:Serine/threonine-protein kinase STY46-like protein [Drosera capensis]
MELFPEGVGESSSPPRSSGSGGGGGGGSGYDVRNDVYNRLIESGNEEAVSNPELREVLDAHFNRLPPSYGLDLNVDRVEDILMHQKLLASAKDPEKRPAFHVRFLENIWARTDIDEDQLTADAATAPGLQLNPDLEGNVPSHPRNSGGEFEPCSKLQDLDLDLPKNAEETEIRLGTSQVPLHELSALLSDIGLNIREAHVFSTTDGYSLDVFVVDGWPLEETEGLHEAVAEAITRSEGSWSGSSHSRSSADSLPVTSTRSGDWEIDRRLLKIGEKIASGSCGDLYHGVYQGQEVAIKILRPEHLNAASEEEFAQEVAILREVEHKNVVRFVGACTKSPHFCIVTEYLSGGSLYNYLHKYSRKLKLSQLLKFAIDVCKGMEYLHQNNIIHRDLKTANLLMDSDQVIKVADFGVARFQRQEGIMTAETGTYRWMAPEVINHQPYDQKADVFSFAIVLWELATAKVPYDTMTPLQAALGVRQGLRPALPENMNLKLVKLMQRCWDSAPNKRPPFSVIKTELEELLQSIQDTADHDSRS